MAVAFLVFGHEPIVDGIFRNAVVVVRGAFHAGQRLKRRHRGQRVAAGGDFDAEALGVQVRDLERVAGARPKDEDDLAARLVLQRIEQALCARGEVGGVGGEVFLVNDLGVLHGALEGLHAVAAEGVVLRQHGDGGAGLVERHGVGDCVLRRIAAGAEDVLVPLVTGDGVCHGGFDQQDLFVLFGDGQHGQRDAGRGRADGNVGVVVSIGRGQLRAGDIRFALVVFFDDTDLAAGHGHRALRGVLQA
ncbi:hypothetical protein D3C73_1106750 [compost metagenome]